MDHATIKAEKEEFAGEMSNYFQPVHAVVKEEPFEICLYPDEEPIVEPIPSPSVLHLESTQVQPGSGSRTTEMETTPPQFVLHPEGKQVQPESGSGTTEMETTSPQSVLHVESTEVQPGSGSGTTETENDAEFWPFSGKPLFSVILARTHVTPPYLLHIPSKMVEELPSNSVPVVLTYCGKRWNMVYLGALKKKRFDCAGWKAFVIANNLKVGYGCFFELNERSRTKIKFRVQILKTDGLPFPDEDEEGETPETPIIID